MKISDMAKQTGVTVRTLHYYDEIGLLKPSEVTEAGYRVYNDTGPGQCGGTGACEKVAGIYHFQFLHLHERNPFLPRPDVCRR